MISQHRNRKMANINGPARPGTTMNPGLTWNTLSCPSPVKVLITVNAKPKLPILARVYRIDRKRNQRVHAKKILHTEIAHVKNARTTYVDTFRSGVHLVHGINVL